MSYVPITAAQALEWAKEDIAAQLTTEHPEASSARNEGIGAAIEVLDRWIRRVQDTKPTKPGMTYRDGGPLGTIATNVRDE